MLILYICRLLFIGFIEIAKGLVAELTPPHVQSSWGFRGKMVRTTGLAACCNYLSKKKNLYRDSEVKFMTDGHNNMTTYGHNDVFDEPVTGWARYAHKMQIWVYNSSFFYIRPTIPSIELLVS